MRKKTTHSHTIESNRMKNKLSAAQKKLIKDEHNVSFKAKQYWTIFTHFSSGFEEKLQHFLCSGSGLLHEVHMFWWWNIDQHRQTQKNE